MRLDEDVLMDDSTDEIVKNVDRSRRALQGKTADQTIEILREIVKLLFERPHTQI